MYITQHIIANALVLTMYDVLDGTINWNGIGLLKDLLIQGRHWRSNG